jgi:glutathione S-transferase
MELYYHPRSRSVRAVWALEEVGRPYELRRVELGPGKPRDPAYLAKNPSGKVPTLVDEGVAISETAAICLYLADKFPDAGLAPATDSPWRGPFLSWLFYSVGVLEPAFTDRLLERESPNFHVAWPALETVTSQLSAALTGHEFVVGDRFSVADIMVGSMVLWALGNGILPAEPPFPGYVERLAKRPAAQRAAKIDAGD